MATARLAARTALLLAVWLCGLCGLALAAGTARPGAVLAYVEQYGETTQLRMIDVDRRLDQRVRNHPDCALTWLSRDRLIFVDVPPGQLPRLVSVSPWRLNDIIQPGMGRFYEQAPAVSPNGQIAYAENWTYDNQIILFDNAGERRVIPGVAIWVSNLQWSADGARILAQGIDESRRPGAYLIDIDAQSAHRLPLPHPRAWLLPDGERAVYEFQGDLFALDVETNAERILHNDAHLSRLPVPSPDGTRIAYVSLSNGARLHLLDLASGTARPLVNDLYTDIDLIAWSPDGRRIAFAARPISDRLYGMLTPYDILIVDTVSGAVWRAKRGAGAYINNFSRFCAFAWMPR
ncbi:MAG: hypothetical protein CUN53_06775 [Phototrophicales bacterium]|nr:MAG: hypothetical protein CUN53_06775 [Phototrophicales bacterium]